jgi:hypothetical protein
MNNNTLLHIGEEHEPGERQSEREGAAYGCLNLAMIATSILNSSN